MRQRNGYLYVVSGKNYAEVHCVGPIRHGLDCGAPTDILRLFEELPASRSATRLFFMLKPRRLSVRLKRWIAQFLGIELGDIK
jgi:hypothetical protein